MVTFASGNDDNFASLALALGLVRSATFSQAQVMDLHLCRPNFWSMGMSQRLA